MFKEGRDATMDKAKDPLPGTDTHHASAGAAPARHGHPARTRPRRLPVLRPAVDPARQPADGHAPPRPVGRPHSRPGIRHRAAPHDISDGPGLVFSALIPDFDHFNDRGGRAFAALHPDGTPNLAPGLTNALASRLGCTVTAPDVLAYIAAIVAHPAYTRHSPTS